VVEVVKQDSIPARPQFARGYNDRIDSVHRKFRFARLEGNSPPFSVILTHKKAVRSACQRLLIIIESGGTRRILPPSGITLNRIIIK